MTEPELKGKLTTLLARLGRKYEGASHPALLVSAHVDEIFTLIKEAGYMKLAEDQTPPHGWVEHGFCKDTPLTDRDTHKEGWRKVKVE